MESGDVPLYLSDRWYGTRWVGEYRWKETMGTADLPIARSVVVAAALQCLIPQALSARGASLPFGLLIAFDRLRFDLGQISL